MPSKSRNVTKIDHTVWPPPINRRKNRKDSHFHSGPFRLRPLLALVLPVSNRHNHHLVTRKAQEATQTKPGSRRRHSERAKGHQTNTTHTLGAGAAALPPDTEQHPSERRCDHGGTPFTEGMWSSKRGRHLVESVSHIFLGYQKPRVSSTARRLEDHTPPRASVGAKP